jgi:acyl carrier protein
MIMTAERAADSLLSARATIETTIRQVADENSKTLAPLADDLPLLESGLDSLCLAVIVARLEDELGVDPFSAADDVAFPVTIGQFIRLYENALV